MTVAAVPKPIRIAALYRFAPLDDVPAIRSSLVRACTDADIRGTVVVAREGVNGTIAGSYAGVEAILEHIRGLAGCSALSVKDSYSEAMPFHRMKVRIKREIVTMGEPTIDALTDAGTYVAPEDWNALIASPGTIVIDTRNAYEVKIGSFAGSIDPKTTSFREFPAWFRAQRSALVGDGTPKVAMFCTGGIRCEKATAFLKSEGVDSVFHLEGGILKYLETTPAAESRWEGECFVFDERVAVGHGLKAGTYALCRACRMPVSAADRASPLYDEGVSCPGCYGDRDDAQRAGYAERHRQALLARGRGEAHVGATYPRTGPADANDPTGR